MPDHGRRQAGPEGSWGPSRRRVGGLAHTIGVLVERRYLSQRQPLGLVAALREAGRETRVLDPERLDVDVGDPSWLVELDGIVVRGRSWPLLCVLSVAEAHGMATVNRSAAIAAVRDKAAMAAVLQAAGVPTPRTHFGHPRRLAARLSPTAYPVIVKPVYGDNCRGLRLAARPQELAALAWPEPSALVQEYLTGHVADLTLYGIGREVVGVRKSSPFQIALNGRAATLEVVDLDPELAELGRRCAGLFGLELWGVDCLLTPCGPRVIEINDFPNYSGVPRADERLADVVIQRLAEAR
jgi:ribosomal protein S6--L-glutamate ligase